MVVLHEQSMKNCVYIIIITGNNGEQSNLNDLVQ